jgi:hypothetical protein
MESVSFSISSGLLTEWLTPRRQTTKFPIPDVALGIWLGKTAWQGQVRSSHTSPVPLARDQHRIFSLENDGQSGLINGLDVRKREPPKQPTASRRCVNLERENLALPSSCKSIPIVGGSESDKVGCLTPLKTSSCRQPLLWILEAQIRRQNISSQARLPRCSRLMLPWLGSSSATIWLHRPIGG